MGCHNLLGIPSASGFSGHQRNKISSCIHGLPASQVSLRKSPVNLSGATLPALIRPWWCTSRPDGCMQRLRQNLELWLESTLRLSRASTQWREASPYTYHTFSELHKPCSRISANIERLSFPFLMTSMSRNSLRRYLRVGFFLWTGSQKSHYSIANFGRQYSIFSMV